MTSNSHLRNTGSEKGATQGFAMSEPSTIAPAASLGETTPPDETPLPPDELEAERQAHADRVAHLTTLGQMSARITHEISQPIYAIMNFSSACIEILSRAMESAKAAEAATGEKPCVMGLAEAGQVMGWLQQVSDQSIRAGEVIRRLANFTREMPMRRVSIYAHQLVRNSLTHLKAELNASNVLVDCEIGSPIDLVSCEPVLVEQVLMKVVRNAAATVLSLPLEERKLIVRTRRLDKRVEFSVEDSGPVELDVLANNFDSFFATSTSDRGQALAVNRTIIEAQAGRLWVEKNPTQGMTVHFTLPLAKQMEVANHVK